MRYTGGKFDHFWSHQILIIQVSCLHYNTHDPLGPYFSLHWDLKISWDIELICPVKILDGAS